MRRQFNGIAPTIPTYARVSALSNGY
jgi:hypothetical protein